LRVLRVITFRMRRKAILLATVPLTSALSLANFQQITSIFIPITCQLTYDSQIPTCKVSDFENGCSSACRSALTSVASDVSDSCSDVSVSSNTLLGIVMNGGIIQALCPATAKTTTTVAQSSSAIAETASAADSVTIPTTSPGVQLSTTTSTTSKASKSTPSSQSAVTTHSTTAKTTRAKTTETTESTESTAAAASSTTVQATEASQSAEATSTSTKNNAATSKTTAAAASTQKASQESDTQGVGSGGGSPFDISSSGTRINGGWMFAFVIAAWACVLLGR
jgi:hypothetical protein